MYLREFFVKNSGPLRQLHINFDFNEDGSPIPYLLVGANGSGKTNFLSIIADALIRGASSFFSDVVTPYSGSGQSYFRIVGGRALTYNEPGGFSVLKFFDGSEEFFFTESTGNFSSGDAQKLLPDSLKGAATWALGEQAKKFPIPRNRVQEIYEGGVYAFFPSNRFEYPNWLNRDALVQDTYSVEERYTGVLNKPLFVEHGIDAFAQWVLGLITDSRMPVAITPVSDAGQVALAPDGPYNPQTLKTLAIANLVLSTIMNDEEAKFFWVGRQDPRKIGVRSGMRPLAGGLDALSGGQTSLLSIFGTLLRYADATSFDGTELDISSIAGVVVIDELDAHMHIDLQMKALPKLISLFPNIQFIVTSHSPFFALGMEKEFPDDKVRIVDLPTGLVVNAEAYNEFGSAISVLAETKAFEKKIGESLASADKPLIWVAGETDVMYLKTAAKLFGFTELIDCIEWIGTPSNAGGGEYTGDSSLKAAVKFLRHNPGFTQRTVIAIFDNDAKQVDDIFGNVHLIALRKIDGAAVEDGIENLLPAHVITEDVIEEKEKPSSIAGKPKIIPELRKMMLAQRLCGDTAVETNFKEFKPYLERIAAIASPGTVPTSG